MKSNELLRLLLQAGWISKRKSGSHHVMEHPTKKGTLIVPEHGSKEVGKGLANKLLKAAGLKR